VLVGLVARVGAQLIDGLIIAVGALILIALLAALGLSVDSDGGAVAFVSPALLAVPCIASWRLLYAPR
jgi:hypothetical protein